MKQKIHIEKFPVYSLEIQKSEVKYATLDEIVAYFKRSIEAHPLAAFVAVFDHYAHSKSLQEANIDAQLHGAMDVVFCFGLSLVDACLLAARPRSIGVAEYADRFVISFIEAPMPVANSAMESWTKGLLKEAVLDEQSEDNPIA